MFCDCYSLADLGRFYDAVDTSLVKDFAGMFHDCESLSEFNFDKMDTNSMTNAPFMFSGCGLKNAMLGKFIPNKSTVSAPFMFADCKLLTKVDAKDFTPTDDSNIEGMFFKCSRLNELLLSQNTASTIGEDYLRGFDGMKGGGSDACNNVSK